jgi:peptide subunit release factor 1 (eRF1)
VSTSDSGRPAAPTTANDVIAKLTELARLAPARQPVISVYLDTRWTDEHQRDRVRVFLENERRKAAAMAAGSLDADLAWVTRQGERLVRQEIHPDAHGVALFAGGAAGLRETMPCAVPFTDRFIVGDTPCLRPMIEALTAVPRAVVLFVDGERARLVALTEQGSGDDVALETPDVVGHHRRGGWSLLLQSRYQRHIQVHRARHFDAVAATLGEMVEHYGVRDIVLAGEARNVAVFRQHVTPALDARIVGHVAGAHHEPSSVLASRARDLVQHATASAQGATLDDVLVTAEGGGRAAEGVDATVEAVNRGTVARLYLLTTFDEAGAVCSECGALQRPTTGPCRWCGKATAPVELGEAMVHRAIATGGEVESVTAHAHLERAGGVAALLRYPSR